MQRVWGEASIRGVWRQRRHRRLCNHFFMYYLMRSKGQGSNASYAEDLLRKHAASDNHERKSYEYV